ncbi:MAG: Membrane protein insertase YidC [Planctomycetota bacterium]|jgi:YidC/Oxa1 family membrane protein insertase
MKRTIVTFVVVAIATALVFAIITGGGRQQPTSDPGAGAAATTTTAQPVAAAGANADQAAASPATTPAQAAGASAPAQAAAANDAAQVASAAAKQPAWQAKPAAGGSGSMIVGGPLTSADARIQLQLTARGAGIERVLFAQQWKTAKARLSAERASAGKGEFPSDDERYRLEPIGTLVGQSVPLLAVHSLVVDGVSVNTFAVAGGAPIWAAVGDGAFETVVHDEAGKALVKARREFAVSGHELRITQAVESLDGRPHAVRWLYYGPGDLTLDAGSLMDIRRFMIGALLSEKRDPGQSIVLSNDTSMVRSSVVSQLEAGAWDLWPTATSTADQRSLSWFGTTNRYFALAIHSGAVNEKGSPVLRVAPAVERIQGQFGDPVLGVPTIFTVVTSAEQQIAPGAAASMRLGVYAGPLERRVLLDEQPMSTLGMIGMIVYEMGGCCTFCTFSWLANGLVVFLGLLHDWVVFDWGLAIIALTILVRLALHPLTRSSQVSIARFSKQMASLKPELDALQKRFAGDKARMQQEQMRLYREKGMNPMGCLGGLAPMVLQMPIWMALYAVLYIAFELRQQPAFFGVFQAISPEWAFLGDLSAPDQFIALPISVNLYLFTLESINLVPLLMGVVFWLQQKYSAPPTTALTPEQEQQQKIMKVMMPIMFPLMLYNAPSGLTLYIATSTFIGFLESKRIRAQIETMDLLKPGKGGGKGLFGGAFARALEQAQAKAQAKQRGGR